MQQTKARLRVHCSMENNPLYCALWLYDVCSSNRYTKLYHRLFTHSAYNFDFSPIWIIIH